MCFWGPWDPGTGTMGPWDPGAWAHGFSVVKKARKKKRAFLTTENPIGSARPEYEKSVEINEKSMTIIEKSMKNLGKSMKIGENP